jgi:deoxyinosine 3'endonuclease (endonuclease V)
VGAVATVAGRLVAQAVVPGVAGAPYVPGLLALREGPMLAAAVRALDCRPDLLLVDATGRDYPRRAGLALHLGAVLDMPTVGVTPRPLRAAGPEPGPRRGDWSPLELDGEAMGRWVRRRARTRPSSSTPPGAPTPPSPWTSSSVQSATPAPPSRSDWPGTPPVLPVRHPEPRTKRSDEHDRQRGADVTVAIPGDARSTPELGFVST